MSVAWVDSAAFDLHTNGPGHPERPQRLSAVREALTKANLSLVNHEPTPVDLELLARIHTQNHIDRVRDTCKDGGPLDAETSVVPDSWSAATRAAGAVVDSVNRVLSGEWKRAFCSVRPPGHHAPQSTSMGFCVFDNVAVGAEAALQAGLSKVAILDWDVHHGNGTQDIFWCRSDVLFASWHQFPLYPGTGREQDTGAGDGEGTTVNCPLGAGSGEKEFLEAWNDRIRPALEEFQPEMLLISAGFDADGRDPLAGLTMTPAGFENLSRTVVEWADAHCQGRVVSTLEGGYDLDALGEDVRVHVETLLG